MLATIKTAITGYPQTILKVEMVSDPGHDTRHLVVHAEHNCWDLQGGMEWKLSLLAHSTCRSMSSVTVSCQTL